MLLCFHSWPSLNLTYVMSKYLSLVVLSFPNDVLSFLAVLTHKKHSIYHYYVLWFKMSHNRKYFKPQSPYPSFLWVTRFFLMTFSYYLSRFLPGWLTGCHGWLCEYRGVCVYLHACKCIYLLFSIQHVQGIMKILLLLILTMCLHAHPHTPIFFVCACKLMY